MTLPDNLSPFEQLQSTIRQVHNKIVKEWFKEDIVDDDINTPETALKFACLIHDNDNGLMMILRIIFFMFYTGYFFIKLNDYAYHWPKHDFHDSIKFLPQIQFNFQETYERRKITNNKLPKRMRTSIRWTYNIDKITETLLNTIRSKIDTEFKNFEHSCGEYRYIYNDEDFNIKMIIFADSNSQAETFFKKMFEVFKILPNNFGTDYSFKRTKIKQHKILEKDYNKEYATVAGDKIRIDDGDLTTGYVKLKMVTLDIKNWFGDNILYINERDF